MDINDLFTDEYVNYLLNMPVDDREDILKTHINYYNLGMETFELWAIIKEKDIDRLKGKVD